MSCSITKSPTLIVWDIMDKQQKTKKLVYITGHAVMLPIMVEIPGGRIIYPNGITQTGFTTRYCFDRQFACLTWVFQAVQLVRIFSIHKCDFRV